ncbi:hypothetical protein Tco_0425970 [Tanacetum coccineum]
MVRRLWGQRGGEVVGVGCWMVAAAVWRGGDDDNERWRCSGAWDGDGGSGVIKVVVLWWAVVGRQPEERAARGGE